MLKKPKKGYITFCNSDREFKENEVLNGSFLVYESLQDSLRFTTLDDDKIITNVTVLDDYKLVDSDYYGYYNMIVTNKILINKIYSYDDVINEMLDSKNELQIERFLSHFRLKDEDIKRFKDIHPYVEKAARYYQDGDKTAYDVHQNIVLSKKQQ